MRTGKVAVRANGPNGSLVIDLYPNFSRSKLIRDLVALFSEVQSRSGTVLPIPGSHGSGSLSNPYLPLPPALAPLLVAVTSSAIASGNNSASVSSPQSILFSNYATFQKSSNGTKTTYVNPFEVNVWSDYRNGTKNPGWKKKIAQGVNATTDMLAQRGVVSAYPASMHAVWDAGSGETEDAYVGFANPSYYLKPPGANVGDVPASLDNGALGKLFDKLYAIQHDADIGETLGEYKQLISLIGHPLQGMRDLVQLYNRRADQVVRDASKRYGRPISRFDVSHVKQVNTALSKLWLEFTFGFKPLYYDLLGCFKAAQDARNSVKSRVSASWRGDGPTNVLTGVSNRMNYFRFNIVETTTRKYTVKYMCGVAPEKVDAIGYIERIGITPSRFVPTLYAILPYSWLLDYFTGINNVINALCSDFKFTTWLCKVSLCQVTHETQMHPDFAALRTSLGASLKGSSGNSGTIRASSTAVSRTTPNTIVPRPTLSVPASWKPWANIATLLGSRKLATLGLVSGTFADYATTAYDASIANWRSTQYGSKP